jgi:hypothetical protein
MERRLRDGRELSSIASVASFFLSRIDVAVDRELRQRIHPGSGRRIRAEAEALLGRPRWPTRGWPTGAAETLRASAGSAGWSGQGARPQRLVWASTGTKDPAYSDVMYVEPLIGPRYRLHHAGGDGRRLHDHGRVAATLTPAAQQQARQVIEGLEPSRHRLGGGDPPARRRGGAEIHRPLRQAARALDQRCARARRSTQAEPLRGVAARLRADASA